LKTAEFFAALDDENERNVTNSIGAFILTTPPEELPSTSFDRISTVSKDQLAVLQAADG